MLCETIGIALLSFSKQKVKRGGKAVRWVPRCEVMRLVGDTVDWVSVSELPQIVPASAME